MNASWKAKKEQKNVEEEEDPMDAGAGWNGGTEA